MGGYASAEVECNAAINNNRFNKGGCLQFESSLLFIYSLVSYLPYFSQCAPNISSSFGTTGGIGIDTQVVFKKCFQ